MSQTIYKVMTVCYGDDEDCWTEGGKRMRFWSKAYADEAINEAVAESEGLLSHDDLYPVRCQEPEPDDNYVILPHLTTAEQPQKKATMSKTETKTKTEKAPTKKSLINKAKNAVVQAERAEKRLSDNANEAVAKFHSAQAVKQEAQAALDALLAS